jgi:hypothetical protein
MYQVPATCPREDEGAWRRSESSSSNHTESPRQWRRAGGRPSAFAIPGAGDGGTTIFERSSTWKLTRKLEGKSGSYVAEVPLPLAATLVVSRKGARSVRPGGWVVPVEGRSG